MTTIRAALWLFHDLTLPSWFQHRLRTVLTLVGVVIGVQAVVAINLINRSTLASFERTAETISGGADLQIANGTAGVPEGLIETVAAVSGVDSAAGLIQGTIRTEWGPLTLFGVDLLADQSIRQTQFPREHVHIPDELGFVNATDSIAVSRAFGDAAGLSLGSSLAATAPTGPVTLEVRGALDTIGPTSLFGGAVGLVDLPTAQRLFALSDRVHQIDIRVVEGADISAVASRISTSTVGAGSVEQPKKRGARLASTLSAVQTVLMLVGLSATIVGAFIIYHTMRTAIVQRRHDVALARAVGYSRGELLAVVTLEALAFGVLGSLLGVVLAAEAARLSLDAVTAGIGSVWARIDRPEVGLRVADYAIALACGVTMALAASIGPMREILTLQVLDQLRRIADRSTGARMLYSALPGAALVAMGFALFLFDLRPEGFSVRIVYIMGAVVLVVLGYAALIPIVTTPILTVCRAVSRRARSLGLVLAAEHLASDSRRSRDAVASLMLAFALVAIVSTFIASLESSITTWLDQTFASHLVVTSSGQLDLPSSPPLASELGGLLASTPGVVEISKSRMINVRVAERLAVLRTESAAAVRRRNYVRVEAVERWEEGFADGSGVLISDNLAYRSGLHAGQRIEFDTPSGRSSFLILATVIDYTLDIGTVIVERSSYERIWRDTLVNSFLLWVDGTDPRVMQRRIVARLPDGISVAVLTAGEFKDTIRTALRRALVTTYAVQVLAMAIALIGVFNFFLADVEDRKREIGLLRGVALDNVQVGRVFAFEALIIGVLGGVMALLYAWPVSLMLVTRSTRLISGWRLTFTFPYMLVLVTVVLAGVTSVVAAYYPVRRITRVPVGELVGME